MGSTRLGGEAELKAALGGAVWGGAGRRGCVVQFARAIAIAYDAEVCWCTQTEQRMRKARTQADSGASGTRESEIFGRLKEALLSVAPDLASVALLFQEGEGGGARGQEEVD